MIKPMGDRVVVEPIDLAEKVKETHSTLVLPDTGAGSMAREREFRLGRVLAVGRGRKSSGEGYIEPGVEVGETIVYRKFTGIETNVDGLDVVILKTDELLAVVRV